MSKVLSDHFWFKNVDFRRFSRGYPKFGYMVSQLSAAIWLIKTKTLLRCLTVINISLRNITYVWNTFRSLFDKKCRFSSVLTGVPKAWVYGVTSVERGHMTDSLQNVAKDLNYYQHKFQEHHQCLKYFQVTFLVKMSMFGVFNKGILR